MQKYPVVNIVFWGTPEFAIPPLEALLAHGYEIAAVVSSPDERTGRKQILTPPPVKTAALRHGLRVLQPTNPISIKGYLAQLSPALFVIAAYGKLLPKEILNIPAHGALNIHPSLLPRWRGPAPIQSTILNGDVETGMTIIKMDEKMDHGPVVANRKSQIANRKIEYKELHDELAIMGAGLLIETLPKWLAGEITPIPQDESRATYSKLLTKNDGRIDWSKPAEEIERMVRAFNTWPSAWTIWTRADRRLRLRIEESGVYEVKPREMIKTAGVVWLTAENALSVGTGRGNLIIKKLTLDGGKTMNAAEFLRGHPNFIGAILT